MAAQAPGNSADAADLAQDAFAGILAACRRHALPDLREPRAYLDALAQVPDAHAPSEQQRPIILQSLQEIDALLDALPAKVRGAFLLSQLDGLTYEQIAAHMEISVRTVKRYMAEAFRHCILAAP